MEKIDVLLEKLGEQARSIDQLKQQIANMESGLSEVACGGISPEAAPGETVLFGAYSWIMLDKRGSDVLLLAHDCVAHRPFSTVWANSCWETSHVRLWLNDDFIVQSFGKRERGRIKSAAVETLDNPRYGTCGGRATHDRAFLLSIEEYERYAQISPEVRGAEPYWLRSMGCDARSAAYVHPDRGIDLGGGYVDYYCGVRPALWVDTTV